MIAPLSVDFGLLVTSAVLAEIDLVEHAEFSPYGSISGQNSRAVTMQWRKEQIVIPGDNIQPDVLFAFVSNLLKLLSTFRQHFFYRFL